MQSPTRESGLEKVLRGMRDPLPSKHYYTLTLTAKPDGTLQWATYSEFVEIKSTSPLVEIRQASLVHADRILDTWRRMGQPCVAVNNEAQLCIYLQIGGHAVIEQSLAKQHFDFILKPDECLSDGEFGFEATFENSALNRAPSKQVRMRVLKRDSFRCRACGRRPADHVDVELHVHHIRPWGSGGPSHENNLITLCHTCHSGLEPHFETKLYDLIDKGISAATNTPKLRQEYIESVTRYRQMVRSRAGSEPAPT